MALHPLGQPLLRWELMEPLPPPTPETYTTDSRIAKVQASMDLLRGSLLEQLHWVNANEPEENTWGFIDCTGLLGRGILPLMPTWKRWLETNDLQATFRDFRKLVQLLIWKRFPPKGGHIILKCPWSASHIQAFSDVFPEATFVITHRDPFRTLASTCTLGEAIYQPFIKTQPGPLHEDGKRGQIVFNTQKMIFRALMEFAKNEPTKINSVRYADLMVDAILTTNSLYDDLGMEVPFEQKKHILHYLEEQRSGKRVTPPERYKSFGYSEKTVWSDPTIVEYCEFFGVQRESMRLIDTKTGA